MSATTEATEQMLDASTPPHRAKEQTEEPAEEVVKETPAEETPAVEEPAQPTIEDRANQLGLNQEQFALINSSDDPEKMLDMLSGRQSSDELDFARQLMRPGFRQPQGFQQPAPQAPPAPAPAPAQEPAKEFNLSDILDEDTLDPEVVGALKGLQEHYDSRIQSLDGTVGTLVDALQEQERVQLNSTFDNYITAQGDKNVFGEGQTESMDPSSPSFAARGELAEMWSTIAHGHEQRGTPIPHGESLRIAMNLYNSEHGGSVERKKIASTLTKRSNQGLARATQRKTVKTPNPEQDTYDAVRETMNNIRKANGKVPLG